MDLRRVSASLLILISAYLIWQGLMPVLMLVQRGSGLSDALLNPPTSLWRLVAAAIALIAGVLAVLRYAGGALLAIAACLLFGVLAFLLFTNSNGSDMWVDEAVSTAVLAALSAGLVVLKRKPATE